MDPEPLLDNRYRRAGKLGEGAFGTVYRARHEVLGSHLRDVALKVFHRIDPAEPVDPTPVLNEALLVTRALEACPDPVTRSRLVTCYDVVPGDEPILVMELAVGDLSRHIAGAQHPAGHVVDLLAEITQGVAFLHDQGVIHLDLKPGNVLRTLNGAWKVGDFGCAAAVQQKLQLRVAGGTLLYQPPELLADGIAGPAADVYALGLIGYELLTGRLPDHEQMVALAGDVARGGDPRELARLKQRGVRPPHGLAPAVAGQPLEQVVLAALDPSPAHRPRDGQTLLRALRDLAWEPTVDTVRVVRELVDQLRTALRSSEPNVSAAQVLARRADEANRDLPDGQMIAEYYPLAVEAALAAGNLQSARELARAGHGRRDCLPTRRAMATAFAGTDVGRGYELMCRAEARR